MPEDGLDVEVKEEPLDFEEESVPFQEIEIKEEFQEPLLKCAMCYCEFIGEDAFICHFKKFHPKKEKVKVVEPVGEQLQANKISEILPDQEVLKPVLQSEEKVKKSIIQSEEKDQKILFNASTMQNCVVCIMGFPNQNDFIAHLKSDHKYHKQAQAETKSLSSNSAFARPSGEKVSCEFCNFKTIRKQGMTRHLNCKHQGKKLRLEKQLKFDSMKIEFGFQCEHCELKASTKYNLWTHVKRNHPEIELEEYKNKKVKIEEEEREQDSEGRTREIQCDQCDKKFFTQNGLLLHRRSHKKRGRPKCPDFLSQNLYFHFERV